VTAATVPAAQVAEVFQLLSDLVSEPRIGRQAARIETESALTPFVARQIAEAGATIRIRSMLAGLLTLRAGGVTEAGLEWAAGWLRTELDRDAEGGVRS
jgi:hypothetical protein